MNVILFMADQMRGDCLGCMGHPVVKTPNLDMLAAQGTLFTRAYTPSPSCIPARACLLTGMNPWHTGILGMGEGMPHMADNYAHTLPGELANAGYHTCAVGKNHFHPQRALNGYHATILDESSRAIDKNFVSDYVEWYGKQTNDMEGYQDSSVDWNGWISRPYHTSENLHPTHWTADRAIEFLKKRDPNKPFFLKCSFARPHSPYDPPQVYYDMYKDNHNIPEPFVGDWSQCNDVEFDALNVHTWRGKLHSEDIRRARAAYYGNITFIDYSIGRVLRTLNSMRLYDDTMILFTSDHGDMLGDHHLWRKTHAYEGSTHIPLLIKPTQGQGNKMQRCGKLTTLMDIMPTVLDAVGLRIPATCDGLSMLPLLQGKSSDNWRTHLLSEHCACYAQEQEYVFVADEQYKLIFFPYNGSLQFFDLIKDPGECVNEILKPEYTQIIADMTNHLVKEFQMRQWPVLQGEQLCAKPDKMVLTSPNAGSFGVQ